MMRSHRSVRAALAALFLLGVTAPAASAHDRPTEYLLDPAGTAAAAIFPEGIAARGDTFYVGSTTDGTVYRGDLRSPTATPFLAGGVDGRTSAVGMKVDGRTLFVAGGGTGRVFAYDVRTGELDRIVAGRADRRPDLPQRHRDQPRAATCTSPTRCAPRSTGSPRTTGARPRSRPCRRSSTSPAPP